MNFFFQQKMRYCNYSRKEVTVFCRYLPAPILTRLNTASSQKISRQGLRVERFTDTFVDWLSAADLSLSMAGYNTQHKYPCCPAIPALMYPFGQNREQGLRISKLCKKNPLRLITKDDLRPERLAALIEETMHADFKPHDIHLDGASRTVQIIEAAQQL